MVTAMQGILEQKNITHLDLEKVVQSSKPDTGCIPNYIPELEHIINHDDLVLSVSDMAGNKIEIGDTKKMVSAQSLIKVLLYAYALEQWVHRYDISNNEAVWLPFNQDPIVTGSSQVAGHALNNAWWISSASYINQRDDFVKFVRTCCENQDINVLQDIYASEKSHRENNLKLSASLAAAGKYPADRIEEVLDYYTKASSLWITVNDALRIGILLMQGGKNDAWERKLQHDTCVYIINAMNSFGLYDESSRINLMVAGTRALAAKSGVSWLILRVNPYVSTYVTLGHHLDRTGNSVFGIQCALTLNILLSKKDALRLDPDTQKRMLEHYIQDTENFTKKEALKRIQKKVYCTHSCLLSHEDIQAMLDSLSTDHHNIKKYVHTCFAS